MTLSRFLIIACDKPRPRSRANVLDTLPSVDVSPGPEFHATSSTCEVPHKKCVQSNIWTNFPIR